MAAQEDIQAQQQAMEGLAASMEKDNPSLASQIRAELDRKMASASSLTELAKRYFDEPMHPIVAEQVLGLRSSSSRRRLSTVAGYRRLPERGGRSAHHLEQSESNRCYGLRISQHRSLFTATLEAGATMAKPRSLVLVATVTST